MMITYLMRVGCLLSHIFELHDGTNNNLHEEDKRLSITYDLEESVVNY